MSGWITAAQWIAPIATMTAAMMTAANLGARITGWGFVVFTIGSISWSLTSVTTGQTNLFVTNCFMTIVNLVGIWRWLGRQAKYQDGAQSAAQKSEEQAGPSLTPASSLCGLKVIDCDGNAIGQCVEALIDRTKGSISYIVVSDGHALGLGEQLRGVALSSCRFDADTIALTIDITAFQRLPVLPDRQWPTRIAPVPPSGD